MQHAATPIVESDDIQKAEEYRRRRKTSVLVVMFSDIQGSTALREQLGDDRFADLLEEHDSALIPLITEHDGTYIKNTGDGFLAVFDKPSEAVLCAVAMQQRLLHHKQLRIRVGMDMGQVAVDEVGGIKTEVFGRFVHRAARVQDLAQAGHVLTTAQIQDSAAGWIDRCAIAWIDHGEYHVKGVEKPLTLWEPYNPSATSPATPRTHGEKRLVEFAHPDAAVTSRSLPRCLLDAPQSVLGQSVGPYELLGFLGQGGSGAVFRARHAATGRTLCIKVMYPLSIETSRLAAVAVRAVRGVVSLNHHNIASIYDFGELVDGRDVSFFLALEYIDGKTLLEWAGPSEKQRPMADRLRIAAVVAEAMHSAHAVSFVDEYGFQQCGVMHGDLKPQNILVRTDDSPAITDFMMLDIHRMLDPEVREILYSQGGLLYVNPSTAFGTPGFMSPEQERDGIVTRQSDIFSLGVTLLLLLGSRPHRHLSFGSLAKHPLCEVLGGCPKGLVALLSDMMKAEPDQRPRNMQEVAERLRSSLRELVSSGLAV